MATTTFNVSGMTCNNCVAHLTEELMENEAVTNVSVALVPSGKSEVTVESERDLTQEEITAAVDEAGYAVSFDAAPVES